MSVSNERNPMIFLDLAREVMAQRDRDGIRGLDRELSRYRCHVATAHFAEKDVADVTSRDIREWLREMADKKSALPGATTTLTRQTVKRSQSLVSAIFVEAVERDLIAGNPCAGVKLRKRVDERDTRDKWAYLMPAEQVALRACREVPIEDRLMLSFSHDTGLRQGEWRHLEIPDLVVDGPDPHVVVRYSTRLKGKKLPPKNSKIRKVPLLPPALSAARTWLMLLDRYAPNNPENLVFPTPHGRVRQQGKPLLRGGQVRAHYATAGIQLRPHLHHHALRHTFASNLITGVYGRPWRLEEVQVVMGHSSFAVTQRYAHMGEDAIRKAARETAAAYSRAS